MSDGERRRREADDILNRVAAETDGGARRSWTDRAYRHFTAAGDTSGDKVEVWGIRVARALAALFIVAMIVIFAQFALR